MVQASEQQVSPYLCRWCRNGRSLNEAHENCLAGGKFDRFWPVEDAVIAGVPPFPVHELAAGKLSAQETRVIVYFYIWLISKHNQEESVKRLRSTSGLSVERYHG